MLKRDLNSDESRRLLFFNRLTFNLSNLKKYTQGIRLFSIKQDIECV